MRRILDVLKGERQSVARRVFSLCCLSALAILVGAGCKPGTKAPGDANAAPAATVAIDPSGTYDLATVDGKAVPCTLTHEGHTMTIKSGRFVINADGTCSSQMLLEGRNVPIEVKATYTREGTRLTMKWQGAGMTEGTVEGGTFTMNNEGMVLAYRK